jgi:hypothetical protein
MFTMISCERRKQNDYKHGHDDLLWKR